MTKNDSIKYNTIYADKLNGNLTDYKTGIKKLNKKQLLEYLILWCIPDINTKDYLRSLINILNESK